MSDNVGNPQHWFSHNEAHIMITLISAVSNVATDVDLGLKEIQQLLDEENKNEEEFQVPYNLKIKKKEVAIHRFCFNHLNICLIAIRHLTSVDNLSFVY